MKRKNLLKIVIGVALILFAVGWICSAFNLWDMGQIKGWWTLILIIPGIVSIIADGIDVWNTLLTGGGLWLLLRAQHFRFITTKQIDIICFSVIIVTVGLWLIFSALSKKTLKDEKDFFKHGGYTQQAQGQTQSQTTYNGMRMDYESKPRYFSFLSSTTMKNGSQNFTGGSAFALLGNCVIDLTTITIRSAVEFDASAVLGKVQIIAPRNARVYVNGTPVLGAYNMKMPQALDADYPVFKISGFALLGNVEIV